MRSEVEAGVRGFRASLELGHRHPSAILYTDQLIVGLHFRIDHLERPKIDIATDPTIIQISVIAPESRFFLEYDRDSVEDPTTPSKFGLHLQDWRVAILEIGALVINYEFDRIRGLYLTAESEVPVGRGLRSSREGTRYIYMRQREKAPAQFA